MILAVEYGAVKVSYAPALRILNPKSSESSAAERSVTVFRHVLKSANCLPLCRTRDIRASCRNAHCADRSQFNIIFASDILGKGSVTFAHTRPNIVEMICPDAVFELIFP